MTFAYVYEYLVSEHFARRTTNAHELTRILIGVDSRVFVLIRGSTQEGFGSLECAILIETRIP